MGARRIDPRYFCTSALISSLGIGGTRGLAAGVAPHRVDDECQRTAGLQHVVDGLGHSLLVGPVEGLAEGHQPVRPWRDRGQVLGQALDPLDVHDSFFLGCATALRLREQMSEADGKYAKAAAGIEKPARSH